jgi:hypothetical protein
MTTAEALAALQRSYEQYCREFPEMGARRRHLPFRALAVPGWFYVPAEGAVHVDDGDHDARPAAHIPPVADAALDDDAPHAEVDELEDDSTCACVRYFSIATRGAAASIAFLVEDADDDRPDSLAAVVEGLLDGSLRDSIRPEVVGAATQCALALCKIAEGTDDSIARLLALTGTPDDLATLRTASQRWWR